jgi:hypothetical protein
MGENSSQFDDAEPKLDPRLREQLSGLFPRPGAIAPEIDAKILRDAKAAYALRRTRRQMARWLGAISTLAAAAVIALVVLVHRPPRPHQIAQLGDFNHDGRVDILDAYGLAKAIAGGAKLDPAWDFNHDGAIDQKDFDWIAATAVNVSGGAPQ